MSGGQDWAAEQIESTGYKPTERQRINDGIAECRRQVQHWLGKLHLLQSLRNQKCGVTFVEREYQGYCGKEMRWFVQLDGKDVCRECGYLTRGQAMAAATQIKAIREAK